MPVQTTVSDQMPRGFAGSKRSDTRTRTALNSEATAEIPFGCGVVQNKASGVLTARLPALLPTAAAGTFIGVVIRDDVAETYLGATQAGPKAGQPMLLGYDGEVLVRVESAVVKGARPFMRFTANGTGKLQLGIFRADADEVSSVATAVEVKGAYFQESGTAGSLVWMRLDDTANRASQSA